MALGRRWVKVTLLEEMAPFAFTWIWVVAWAAGASGLGATTVSSLSEAARMSAGWSLK